MSNAIDEKLFLITIFRGEKFDASNMLNNDIGFIPVSTDDITQITIQLSKEYPEYKVIGITPYHLLKGQLNIIEEFKKKLVMKSN